MLCQASGVCFLLLVSAINLSTSDNSSLPNTIAENILFDTNTTSIKNKLQSTNNEDTEYSVQTATELIYDGLTTELTFNDIAEFNDSSTDFTSTDSTTDFTSTDSTTTLTSTDSTTALTSTDSTTAVTSTDSTTDLTSIDPTTESTTIEVTSTELTTTTCPSIPENVETITLEPDKYSIMVRWTSNSNSDCVSEYNIKWKPVVKDDIMEEYTSASEYNITDLEACTEYEVTVTAIYDGSMSKPVSQKNFTETGDLRKVENLKLRPETNSVIVTWSEPPHSGACVEEYYIEWKDESDSPSNVSVKELSHTIPKLRACTEYEIHVTAVYESGDSESEYATTSTDFADPQEVENLLMEPDTRSIKVTWSEPNGSDACIRTYNIKWQDEAGNPLQANTSDLHYNISNLKACTFYEVNVTAIYKNDESVLASIMDTTKTADPQKVENLVTESDTHSIMVTWLKPKDSDACIKTYNLKWKDDAGSPLQANTLDLFYNISNLKACTHYEINVTAIYINDRSFLVPIRNTTKTAVPGHITNLSLKPDQYSIMVNWNKPLADAECVASYIIQYKSTASNDFILGNTMDLSYKIINLKACTDYEIQVFARNEDYNDSVLMSGQNRTLTAVPGHVTNLSLKPDQYSIIVNWNKPLADAECVASYIIQYKSTASNDFIVGNTMDLSYKIINLKACTDYEIQVFARNEDYNDSVLMSGQNRTLTAVPGHVTNLSLKPDQYSIIVNWNKPLADAECVASYIIQYKSTASNDFIVGNTMDLSYKIINLKACTDYEIQVFARNEDYNDSVLMSGQNRTLTAVPEIVTNLSVKAVTLSSLSVQWKRPERTGNCIKKYKLEWKDVAGNYSTNNNTFPNTESYELKDLIPCATYEISVQAVNTDESYSDSVSGKEKTLAEVSDAPSDPQQVCTGTDNVCLRWTLPDINSNRCNRLKFTAVCTEKDTPEQLKFEATSFDLNNDTIDINVMGLSSSTAYLCQGKMENNAGISNLSEIIEVVTESDVPVGMIVGILLAVVALGIFALLYVSYRKGALVWPPKFFSGAKQTTVRPQPVLVRKFPEYCTRMLEIPTRLDNEYQLLKTLSVDIETSNTFDNGKLPANKRKNRYVNILPYDATRVTLDVIDGDPTSHYINASFIKGYNDDIEYIAAQGPTEDTTMDFWRMVFQHDVRVIVMVTNLVEQERIKCHQYYPNLRENVTYGDMTICCTTEIKFPIHTARTLVLMKGDRKRTLSHLHFREWPDFGVPHSTDLMIQFCQTMRHHAFAAELGLILVHCSAGVGRTGTLIAVDILLQHICENKKVDIFGTVFKLRKQRMNMVQTEGQYAYIYRCIKDAVEDPTIVKNGTPTNNSLEPIYENVGTSLNTLQQYEKLPKWPNKDGEV
ncbi:receptor-type tyrosine-protein phosphatase H-like isoform X2 [Periplaneta americana]|uniref:receptor-type tyrosine-protein phosphatase H-like isoform X2 n=1 Tax=Periplaneta americana TaxID=6978 RepID=UPI0037E7794C